MGEKRPKAAPRPVTVARELLATLSLDAVLVEDMAVMDAGIAADLVVPAAAAEVPAASAREADSSSSSAWRKWAGAQKRDDDGTDDRAPEVISMSQPPEKPTQGRRRA